MRVIVVCGTGSRAALVRPVWPVSRQCRARWMELRISSTSFSRPAAIMSHATACAVNSDDRATWICTSVRRHSRFSSHCVASSASSRFAVVSRSLAYGPEALPYLLVDANVLVDGPAHSSA